MVSLPDITDPTAIVNTLSSGLSGLVSAVSGKAAGIITAVSQLDSIYQFFIFGIFIFVAFKIAQILIRAVYVAIASAAFPLFLKYIMGLKITLTLQTMLSFTILGVTIYLTYEKITMIMKIARGFWRFGKVLTAPLRGIGRTMKWAAKGERERVKLKYVEIKPEQVKQHDKVAKRMVKIEERKERRQRKRRAKELAIKEKEEEPDQFKQAQQKVDGKKEEEAEEIWEELEEDEEEER